MSEPSSAPKGSGAVDAVWSVASLTREFFGFRDVERTATHLKIRSTQCPLWEAAKRLGEDGLTSDAFCRPHETFYQEFLTELGSEATFRFESTLGRGDSSCHWSVEDATKNSSA